MICQRMIQRIKHLYRAWLLTIYKESSPKTISVGIICYLYQAYAGLVILGGLNQGQANMHEELSPTLVLQQGCMLETVLIIVSFCHWTLSVHSIVMVTIYYFCVMLDRLKTRRNSSVGNTPSLCKIHSFAKSTLASPQLHII